MGIMLIYDVTDERSFNNIRNWIRNIDQYATEGVNKILIGNKCDDVERRVVGRERGAELAREYGLKFMETSAKNNVNVDEAFLTLARDIKKRLIDTGKLLSENTTNNVNAVSLNKNNNLTNESSSGSGGSDDDRGGFMKTFKSNCC